MFFIPTMDASLFSWFAPCRERVVHTLHVCGDHRYDLLRLSFALDFPMFKSSTTLSSISHFGVPYRRHMNWYKNLKTSLDQFAVQTRKSVASTAEQTKAGADVAKQVDNNVSESANVTSATTTEVARTATELANLSAELQVQIRHFKLIADKA